MNVVFDLGGVVVAWRPDDIIANAFDDPAVRVVAREHVLMHDDWLAMDRGTMTVDDAVARGAARSGLVASEVRRLIDSVPPSLEANPETIALMERVKANGNALYCLSNMPLASMEYLERRYDFWHLFDGLVISSRVNLCKPEPEIFEHLLSTFSLQPRETVFIDDVLANVEAAARVGIRTIQFTSPAQCEAELHRLGAL